MRPEFSTAGIAPGSGLLAYLVLLEPVLGVRSYAYLRRHRGRRPGALSRVYQGWLGVLATTVLGALFAALYLATESLLLPIVLHIAFDLRGLLLTPLPGEAADEPPGD